MTSVAIMAGNSDNMLTQQEWATFVDQLDTLVRFRANATVHFFGGPPTTASRQNVCWVVELHHLEWERLKPALATLRAAFRQESLAVVESPAVEFI